MWTFDEAKVAARRELPPNFGNLDTYLAGAERYGKFAGEILVLTANSSQDIIKHITDRDQLIREIHAGQDPVVADTFGHSRALNGVFNSARDSVLIQELVSKGVQHV